MSHDSFYTLKWWQRNEQNREYLVTRENHMNFTVSGTTKNTVLGQSGSPLLPVVHLPPPTPPPPPCTCGKTTHGESLLFLLVLRAQARTDFVLDCFLRGCLHCKQAQKTEKGCTPEQQDGTLSVLYESFRLPNLGFPFCNTTHHVGGSCLALLTSSSENQRSKTS